MKRTLITVLLAGLCCTPALAADDGATSGKPRPSFEERKAEILAHLAERNKRSQEEQACVQAAQNHEALKACREQFRPEQRGDRPRGDGGGARPGSRPGEPRN